MDDFPTVDELIELRHQITQEQVQRMRHNPSPDELHRIDLDPSGPTDTASSLADQCKWITRVLPNDDREIRGGTYSQMWAKSLECLRKAKTPKGSAILVTAHLRAHRDFASGNPVDRFSCKVLKDQYTPMADEVISSVTVKLVDMGAASQRKVMDIGTNQGRLFRLDPERPRDLRVGRISGIVNKGRGEFRAISSGANLHCFAAAYTGEFILDWDEWVFKPVRDLKALNEQKAFSKLSDVVDKEPPQMYESDPYPYKLPDYAAAS